MILRDIRIPSHQLDDIWNKGDRSISGPKKGEYIRITDGTGRVVRARVTEINILGDALFTVVSKSERDELFEAKGGK